MQEEAEKYGSTHPGFEPPEKMLRLTKEETVISGGTVEKVKKYVLPHLTQEMICYMYMCVCQFDGLWSVNTECIVVIVRRGS